MVVNLSFKDTKTLKIRTVQTEVYEPSLFSFLINTEYLITTINTLEKNGEYLINIIDKDPITCDTIQ